MRLPARVVPAALLAGWLAVATAPRATAGPPWVLGFDEVAAGTVLNELYAGRGVHLRAFGEGFLNNVIADTACVPTTTAPNVLSLRPVAQCPVYSEQIGWIRATFDLPQPRVSIALTHAGDGVASYLRAFRGASLLDLVFGQSGPAWNGVPQTLEIRRRPGDPLIEYVEFGAFLGSDPVQVDQLSYDQRPVAAAARSWSALKARFP